MKNCRIGEDARRLIKLRLAADGFTVDGAEALDLGALLRVGDE